jgi:prepilin-type N-terminal cleavage/methylation domain-containing protein
VKKSRAFTLIELLVVVAIIALLISILLPSLSRARELSKRTMCAANERGVGQAFYIYAQDDPGFFPAIAQTSTNPEGSVHFFFGLDRTTQPSTSGVPSPTVDMWAVVRANNTTPKQFICPSTPDVGDPAQDTSTYFDFYKAGNLSYGYQYQHSPKKRIVGTSSEPTYPVLADGNPWVKGGLAAAGADITDDRNKSGHGNSFNHTNREGQNVLFQDSHVSFEKGPDCGPSGPVQGVPSSRNRDNIYTVFNEDTMQVDPGDVAPTGTLVMLGGESDACLVP